MGNCLSCLRRLLFGNTKYDEETDSLVTEIEPDYIEKEYEEIRQSSDSVVL